MTVRKTIEIGDKRLKSKNKKIHNVNSPHVKRLIKDLTDTMHEYQLIGIAAPQIAQNYQIFLTEPRETENRPKDQSDILRVFINPKIVETAREETIIYEGCGCMPSASIFGPVSRPKWVKIQATDEHGTKFTFKADGILGRVIFHEYDHLQGIEFIQKVTDNSKIISFAHYIKNIKNAPWHKKNSEINMREYERLE